MPSIQSAQRFENLSGKNEQKNNSEADAINDQFLRIKDELSLPRKLRSKSLESKADHRAKKETYTAHCQREADPSWQSAKSTNKWHETKSYADEEQNRVTVKEHGYPFRVFSPCSISFQNSRVLP